MRVLFIGDSIIRGTVGVDFVSQIAADHPDWQIENAGVNGEPIVSIAKRLEKVLARKSFEVIVLQGGSNDLLLPTFAQRGFWFRQALKAQLRAGHVPAVSLKAFEEKYRRTISLAQQRSHASIILVTLGCCGENLTSELNASRNEFNNLIRKAAHDFNCGLADIAVKVDGILATSPPSSYFLDSFVNTAFLDLIRCSLFGQADRLSEKRGQYLTIDGGHLNSRGATIYKEELEKQIALALASKTTESALL